MVNILVHEGCCESSETDVLGSETHHESSERKKISSETASKSSERKSSERILDLIKNKPTILAAEIAMEIDMSSRGVEKQIKKLRETGIIKLIGADFGGYWEIVNLDNDKNSKILPFYFAVSCICTNFTIGNRLKWG